MTPPRPVWDDPARRRLAELADVLLPAGGDMPAASDVDVHTTGTDRVLEERPDLAAPLRELVRRSADEPVDTFVAGLQLRDPAGWLVLTTCVAAAYYMTPAVRRRLGYAGQEGVLITAEDFYGWAATGLLDPVLERGPIHRPTPSDVAPAHCHEGAP